MADDLFGLAQGPLAEAPLPAPAPPTPPQPQRQGWKQLGPLAALIPLAMKSGGMPAVSALLAGMQQGRAQQGQQAQQGYQNARQSWMDQNTVQAQQEQAKARADAAAAQQMQAQRQLLQDFMQRSQDLTDPAQVESFLGLYPNLDRNAAAAYINGMLTPDARQKKAVGKFLDALESDRTIPADRLAQMEQSGAVFAVPGVDRKLTLPEMRAIRYGSAVDQSGAPMRVPAKPVDDTVDLSKSGLDVQANYARRMIREAKQRGDSEAVAKWTAELNDTMQTADEMSARRQNPPIQVSVGGSGITQAQQDVAAKYRADYQAQSKDYYTVRNAYERVQASGADPSPAGDLALLFAYMKILDPGSVVRETEFANAAKTGSLPQQIQAAALRVVTGERLTPQQRADFLNRAKGLYAAAERRQNKRTAQFRQIAQESGVPPNLVVIDEVPADEPAAPSAPPTAAPGAAKPRIRYDMNGRPIG